MDCTFLMRVLNIHKNWNFLYPSFSTRIWNNDVRWQGTNACFYVSYKYNYDSFVSSPIIYCTRMYNLYYNSLVPAIIHPRASLVLYRCCFLCWTCFKPTRYPCFLFRPFSQTITSINFNISVMFKSVILAALVASAAAFAPARLVVSYWRYIRPLI